jgi:DivIVA domain-containing protein
LDGFFNEPSSRYAFDVVLRGYDRHPVHEMLRRVEKTLAGTVNELEHVTPDVIRATKFNAVLRGYHRRQVDAALLDCIQRLEAQG